MRKQNSAPSILLLLLLAVNLGFAQSFEMQGNDTINKTDEQGWKQGKWMVVNIAGTMPGCKDGQKLEEGNYVNNRKVGTWKLYHCNGRVKCEMVYGEDKSAFVKNYYENGVLREQGTWKNNTWTGDYKYFYETGKPFYEFAFNEDGKREGFQKYFYENGNTMYEGTWKDSKEAGVIKEYYEDGSLKAEKSFNDGKIDENNVKNYAPQAKEKKEEPVVEKKVEPIVQEAPDMRVPDGKNKTYYSNGKLERDGEFLKGKLFRGKHYFYKDGELHKTVYYEEGRPARTVYAKDEIDKTDPNKPKKK
jgi:antitoxin component YwqK of YwqJK toxin-antitoxin module